MNNPQYMSGTGNNFLVSEYENTKTDIEIISIVADSLFDVDGVIFVEKIDTITVKMHYYNSDGSTAELCVNGIRCVAKYALDNSIIDSVSIEDAHRYNDLTLLKDYKNTKVIFGLIKIASSKIETVEEIENRIEEVLKFISKEQLIAAPDCGLGHLSRELAMKKLKIMSLAAKKFN